MTTIDPRVRETLDPRHRRGWMENSSGVSEVKRQREGVEWCGS